MWRLSSRHTRSPGCISSRVWSRSSHHSRADRLTGETQLPSAQIRSAIMQLFSFSFVRTGLHEGWPVRVLGISVFALLPPADLGTVVRLQDSASRRSRISASGFRHHTRRTNSFICLSHNKWIRPSWVTSPAAVDQSAVHNGMVKVIAGPRVPQPRVPQILLSRPHSWPGSDAQHQHLRSRVDRARLSHTPPWPWSSGPGGRFHLKSLLVITGTPAKPSHLR